MRKYMVSCLTSKHRFMRVLFVVPYPEHHAPSQRLKFEQYYGHFRRAGIEVEHRSFMSLAFWKIVYEKDYFLLKLIYTLSGYVRRFIDLFRLHRYDVVYVHLWVTPIGPPVFEWLYRKLSKSLVYDIDDLIYLSGSNSKANKIIASLKGRKKPLYLMRVSDHVITCTPHLDNFARRLNNNTTDIKYRSL
jgi:hypothetical protein